MVRPVSFLNRSVPILREQPISSMMRSRQIDWLQALIYSMTPEERANPSIINPSRKRRIAAGSGRTVEEVNKLLKQLEQMQKMIKQMKGGKGSKKRRKNKMLPGLGGMPMGGGNGMPF